MTITKILCCLAVMSMMAFAHCTENRFDSTQIEIGRQIYELGILPNKQPLRGSRTDGLSLQGSAAACITCHRRSGMGSIEGSLNKTILIPPVMGQLLFSPTRFSGAFLDPSHHYIPNESWVRALTRPAYTSKSLDRALREGIDSAGKPLAAPMLRYQLDDTAMTGLIAYLQQLSGTIAPGVTTTTLHLSTIITDEATTEETAAVLGVIKAWSASSRTAGKSWQLHIWKLSGNTDSWSKQLAEYNNKQPVFAVLSGIGAASWLPVHQFCEAQRLPCILPSLEIAPEEKSNYYSVYFSPGATLEARLLARHLHTRSATGGALVQIYSDATGNLAAEEFRNAQINTKKPPEIRRFRTTAPAMALDNVDDSTLLMLWLRPSEIQQLVESWPQPPVKEIFISALLAPPEEISMPPAWKKKLVYISLFDDLSVQGQIAKIRLEQWLDWHNLPYDIHLRQQADAYTACYLFNEALAEIRSQEVRRPSIPLNREHLLETLETLVSKYDDGTTLINPDSHIAYYGRMSLGPSQRIAVRGGALFRYATAESNKLVAAGPRIVP